MSNLQLTPHDRRSKHDREDLKRLGYTPDVKSWVFSRRVDGDLQGAWLKGCGIWR